jgi:hypothetical protein
MKYIVTQDCVHTIEVEADSPEEAEIKASELPHSAWDISECYPSEALQSELTNAQIEQQDKVQNACYQFICDLAGQELEWDMEWVGDLADTVKDIICDRLDLMSEMEFYPYIER